MKLLERINIVFNNFIISRHPLSIEELWRRRLFIIFVLLMLPPLFIFGTTHIKNGMYKYGAVDYLLILSVICLIIMLQYLKSGKKIYRLSILILGLSELYWIKTGVIMGYGSIWGLMYPLFSFYLLGKREGFVWTAIFIFVIALIFINPYSCLAVFSYPFHYYMRFLFLFLMIFLFTFSYESVREKFKISMEQEQRKLVIESEKLAKAKEDADRVNRLLLNEMQERNKAERELLKHHEHLEEMISLRTNEIQKNIDKLELSEKRFRLLADNVDDMIWSIDMDLNFTFISPSVNRMFGYTIEEAIKIPHEKWSTNESFEKMINIFSAELEIEKTGNADPGRNAVLQIQQIKKDGTVFWAELKVSFIRDQNGKAIGLAGITRNIDDRVTAELEREKIQEHLAQSQKMDALGTLVGGLAHDFNNFLGGIMGSFNLLTYALETEKLEKQDAIEEYLQTGMESSKRSADLIRQLLILSKKHEIILSPIDINKSINHIHELCKNSLPKIIELNFKAGDTPLVIIGDMVQIEQVLLNFCINASHAMTLMVPDGEKHGGVLTVTAEEIKSDYIMKESHPEIYGVVGSWIRIQISDTGVGMDNETKQRIFEPFFSTKGKNVGTGLGLAISYNIIKKHGGVVHVYSEQGFGSRFSIYFPVFKSDIDIPGYEPKNNNIVKGSGTILVIDDEAIILKVAKRFLEQCGYDVIIAEGADCGIDIYREKNSMISAVIIDFLMPGKSGFDVFRELKKINPGVKALLSSGMLDNDARDEAVKLGIKETLNKPYLGAELSVKIKAIIENEKRPPS